MSRLDIVVEALRDNEEAPPHVADLPPAGLLPTIRDPSAECAGGEDCGSDVDAIVARAVQAQRQFAAWDERQIDGVLERVAESVALAAEDLARYAADETGMGNARDKSIKISFASRTVQ